MMGLTYLPYHPCQAVTWTKMITLGDRWNLKNLLGGIQWYITFRGQHNIPANVHVSTSRVGMELLWTNCLFMWNMGALFYLQNHCVGKHPEGEGRPAHGWKYRICTENFNPLLKYQDLWQ